MDGALCSLSFFMILTLFQSFSLVQSILARVKSKFTNRQTLHRFRDQEPPANRRELTTRCQGLTGGQDMSVRQTIRRTVFPGGISLLPVLIQGIGDPGHSHRSRRFAFARRWTAIIGIDALSLLQILPTWHYIPASNNRQAAQLA
jgi:hypothetical protein